jgi:hypothetical protein
VVGADVGAIVVGRRLGVDKVGFREGVFDGCIVGCSFGYDWQDGTSVGWQDGTSVGVFEGLRVGATVGDEVA